MSRSHHSILQCRIASDGTTKSKRYSRRIDAHSGVARARASRIAAATAIRREKMSIKNFEDECPSVRGPTNFLDGLLTRDRVASAMTRHFFEGRSDLFEKYWDTIKEHELRHFFRKYFGKTVEKKDRPYAFVVYGASGYTGSLILEYIYSNADKINLGTDLTFALAGRTPEKLQARLDEVLEKFPDVKYRPDIFKVNIDSTAHIREMILKCRCVLNVAGPFLNTKADLLVEGCIEYDCDYVDVNGEVPFTHKLIGMHDWAKKKNVLIVPNSAGAGGLPDVAAFYTSEELKKKAKKDADVEKMHCFMFSNGGAPSGGTLATRAAMTASIKHVAKIMGNPFALGGVVGDGKRPEDQDRELNSVRYFKEFEGWSGAFTVRRLPPSRPTASVPTRRDPARLSVSSSHPAPRRAASSRRTQRNAR